MAHDRRARLFPSLSTSRLPLLVTRRSSSRSRALGRSSRHAIHRRSFSPKQIEHRLKKENDSLQKHHFQYWPVFLLSDGQHVGCAGIRPYRPEEEIHELGFHLRPEFWSQGLAEEAARAVMAYAFETLNAKALSAGHHPANASSRHILEKLGFHFSHEEFYAPCGLQIPYYLLASPSISPP